MTKRNSSIELLRIILMFMVIIGHANMWYFGFSYESETEHVFRVFLQVLCMPAVNAFVLISGWFGIKSDINKVLSVLFQMFFLTIPIVIMMLIAGKTDFLSIDGLNQFVFGGNNYWFIIDYVGLLLFAPILNTVISHSSKKELVSFLLAFPIFLIPFDVILRSNVLGVGGGIVSCGSSTCTYWADI